MELDADRPIRRPVRRRTSRATPGGRSRSWLRGILPARCLLCGGRAGRCNLCEGCLADLPHNRRACPVCALPLPGAAGAACGQCLIRRNAWDCVHAPLRYEFPVDVLVKMLKFRGRLAAGRALAGVMAATAPPLDPRQDRLLPVPLHWRRRARRGYNQAAELTLHLGRLTGVPVCGHWLRRPRSTQSQTGLDISARARNVRGAFRWCGPAPAGLRVLLVDDVMTTGSTIAECARLARRAGADRVEPWVAARALHD